MSEFNGFTHSLHIYTSMLSLSLSDVFDYMLVYISGLFESYLRIGTIPPVYQRIYMVSIRALSDTLDPMRI